MENIQTYDSSVDMLRALLWQDNDAPNLTSLLKFKQAWLDQNQSQFWNDWYTNVFDVRTANTFGLAVWAIILGLSTSVVLPPSDPSKPAWGFGPYQKNFNNGNFSSQASTTALLTLEQKRMLIRLRFVQITSRCAVPGINAALKAVLGSQGSVYVLDSNDMTYATYVLGFQPDSALAFVLQNFDILPRPAGVGTRFIISTRPTWGFETFNKNFDHGNFLK